MPEITAPTSALTGEDWFAQLAAKPVTPAVPEPPPALEAAQITAPTTLPATGEDWFKQLAKDRAPALTAPVPAAPAPNAGEDWFRQISGIPKTVGQDPAADTSAAERFKQAWTRPDEGLVGHMWDVANTPGWDEPTVENWLGTNLKPLGFEVGGGGTKGVAGLISGMTTPLSLALILGGPLLKLGGLVESGGAALLKSEAIGMSAADVATIEKGAAILAKTVRAGKTEEAGYAAAQAAGYDAALVKRGLEALHTAGLTNEALLSNGLLRRTASSALRTWTGPAKAEWLGARIQGAVDATFTGLMAWNAVTQVPRALDALRDGDWEHFKEYGIEGLGSAIFAGLGARGALREAGGLVNDTKAFMGLQVKPNEENLALQKIWGVKEGSDQRTGRALELWEEDVRNWSKNIQDAHPGLDFARIKQHLRTPEDLAWAKNWIEAGGDLSKMGEQMRNLARASGRADLVKELDSAWAAKRGDAVRSPIAEPSAWAALAHQVVLDTGGATWNPRFGRVQKGLAGEIYPEARTVLDHKADANDIADFYRKNEQLFQRYPELHIGVFENELNVAAHGFNPERAKDVFGRLDQRSYADLAQIPEKGTAPDSAFIPAGGAGVQTEFPDYPLEARLADLRGDWEPLAARPTLELPTVEEVKRKYGATKDLTEGFLHEDGTISPAQGAQHDAMLGQRVGSGAREQFINQNRSVRVSEVMGMGGHEFHFSIPEDGVVTPEQATMIAQAAKKIPNGRVVIESARPYGRSVTIDFPKAGEIADELAKFQEAGAWASRAVPRPEELTPIERKQLVFRPKADDTARFVEIFNQLPEVEDLVAAARKGVVGRFWYQRSTAAFQALRELAPDYFKPEDTERWAGVVAATSPQQAVAMNLTEGLRFWKEWVDAGRPMTDEAVKDAIRSRQISKLTNQPSKLPNVMRALRGEDFLPEERTQNFKVGNFFANLIGLMKHTTHDSWMGIFHFGDPDAKVGGAATYHAMALRTRQAADVLGWQPAEAQAAIWTFTKTLSDLSGWQTAGGRYFRPADVLPMLDRPTMEQYAQDFGDIMRTDGEVRDQLKGLGVDLNELDKRLEALPAKPVEGGPAGPAPAGLIRSAERIGEAQRKLAGFTSYREPLALGGEPGRPPAISEIGDAFELTGGDVSFDPETFAARSLAGFYSKAEQVATQKLGASGTGDQILATLRNNGVRAEEISRSGLDTLAGEAKVSKDEVLTRLREAQIPLEIVTKGGEKIPSYRVEKGTAGWYYILKDGLPYEQAHSDLAAVRRVAELRKLEAPDPKYPQYVLPGGHNYQERLITIPTKEGLELGQPGFAQKAIDKEAGVYRSPHWDEPNVVAHYRTTDRALPDGGVGRLVEEVQSDWHQSGRERGYAASGPEAEKIKTEWEAAREKYEAPYTDEEIANYFKPGTLVPGYAGTDKVLKFHPAEAGADYPRNTWSVDVIRVKPDGSPIEGEWVRNHATTPSREEMRQDLRDKIVELQKRMDHTVPDAPFKTTWHELAMKSALRDVAEYNAAHPDKPITKLMWTTGEQQAARYNLSKQIAALRYEPPLPGGDRTQYIVTAELKDGALHNIGAYDAAQLPGVVGKDVAKRMVEGAGEPAKERGKGLLGGNVKRLAGLDLKIGGEGMKGFYDKILPDFMNRYVKKWGARVGESDIGKPGPKMEVHRSPDGGWDVWDVEKRQGVGEVIQNFDTEGAANSYVADFKARPVKVHSIDITPEMQRSVMDEGQPLFARGPAVQKPDISDPAVYAETALAANFSYQPREGTKPGFIAADTHTLDLLRPFTNLPGAWNAVTYQAHNVPTLMEAIRGKAESLKAIDPAAADRLEILRNHFGVALQEHPQGGVAVARPGTLTVAHELTHVVQMELGSGRIFGHANLDELTLVPEMRTFTPNLVRMGYSPDVPHVLTVEAATHILAGQGEGVGGTLAERASFITKYLRSVADTHGPAAIGRFENVVPTEMRSILRALREKLQGDEQANAQLERLGRAGLPAVGPEYAAPRPGVPAGAVASRAGAGGPGGVEETRGGKPIDLPEGPGQISPEEFLRQAKVDEESLSDSDRTRIEYYRTQIANGQRIPPIEQTTDSKGNDVGHDGVLRAIALRDAGVRSIPVNTHRLGGPNAEIGYLASRTDSPSLNPERAQLGMDEARQKELIDAQHLKNSANYTDAEREALIRSYDPRRATPELLAIAKEAKGQFDKNFQDAANAGALTEAFEHYATHVWGPDAADNPAVQRLMHEMGSRGFATSTSMARERLFANAYEGQLLGKRLKVTDPITLARFNGTQFAKVAAARDFLDRLRSTNVRGSDGRAAVALTGNGRIITGEDGKPSVMVNPNAVRSIRIADKVVAGWKPEELDRLLKENKVDKRRDKNGREFYAWTPYDYKHIDHPALRDWVYATHDTGGNPVYSKDELVVHPEFEPYLRRLLDREPSPLKQIGLGRAALAAGQEAKGILLFGSPFHLLQEGLRAVLTGVSPFGTDRWDLRTNPTLSKLVEGGMTLKSYGRDVESFEAGKMYGHSKVLSKIPGINRLQDGLQRYLFDQYIPSLKSRAGVRLFEEYRSAHPDWTVDKVAEVAAADTNERFGGINYKRLGRSVATQDMFRLVALAPDWLESEMRFLARTMGDEGGVARKDVATLAVKLWLAARVLNYLSTGQPHNEAPFGLAYKDKDGREKIYSVRTLPTDMLHAVSDPGGFLSGRVAPLARSAVQMYTGRDDYGRKVPTHDFLTNVARQASPIWAQTMVKSATGEIAEVTTPEQVVKGLGGTVYPFRTEAQNLSAELASDHAEAGPVDPGELRKHQAILKFEGDLRSGQMPIQDFYQLVRAGQIAPADAKKVLKNVQDTRGMTPDMARLWMQGTRLPMPEFLRVYDLGTSEEKAALTQLLIKKRQSYYKKIYTEMTPEQRAVDPTYRRLQQMFPKAVPF